MGNMVSQTSLRWRASYYKCVETFVFDDLHHYANFQEGLKIPVTGRSIATQVLMGKARCGKTNESLRIDQTFLVRL